MWGRLFGRGDDAELIIDDILYSRTHYYGRQGLSDPIYIWMAVAGTLFLIVGAIYYFGITPRDSSIVCIQAKPGWEDDSVQHLGYGELGKSSNNLHFSDPSLVNESDEGKFGKSGCCVVEWREQQTRWRRVIPVPMLKSAALDRHWPNMKEVRVLLHLSDGGTVPLQAGFVRGVLYPFAEVVKGINSFLEGDEERFEWKDIEWVENVLWGMWWTTLVGAIGVSIYAIWDVLYFPYWIRRQHDGEGTNTPGGGQVSVRTQSKKKKGKSGAAKRKKTKQK